MKRLLPLLLALCLICSLSVPISASSSWIVDDADLLTSPEISKLNDMAQDISDTYDLDTVILTVDNLDGWDIVDFADEYYDRHHYREDCILLVVSMAEREYYIRTIGSADDIFTNSALMDLEDRFLDDLSDGDYYDAFAAFLRGVESELEAPHSSTAGDSDTDGGVNLLLSIAIGAVAAGVAVLIMRSQMNTAKPQKHAVGYIRDGSYQLTEHMDLFLYSRVTKTAKPQNNGSGRSGGGSRGGRGGRF